MSRTPTIYKPGTAILRVSSQEDFVHVSADVNRPVALMMGSDGEDADETMNDIWDQGLHIEQNNWVVDVHPGPLGVKFKFRPFDVHHGRASPGARYIDHLPDEYQAAHDIFERLSCTFRAITDSRDHQLFCIPRCATSSHTHDHAVITQTFLYDLGTIIGNDNAGRTNMLWIPVGEEHESPKCEEDRRLVISASPVIA